MALTSLIPGQFHQHHHIKEDLTLRGHPTVFSRDVGVIPNDIQSETHKEALAHTQPQRERGEAQQFKAKLPGCLPSH